MAEKDVQPREKNEQDFRLYKLRHTKNTRFECCDEFRSGARFGPGGTSLTEGVCPVGLLSRNGWLRGNSKL